MPFPSQPIRYYDGYTLWLQQLLARVRIAKQEDWSFISFFARKTWDQMPKGETTFLHAVAGQGSTSILSDPQIIHSINIILYNALLREDYDHFYRNASDSIPDIIDGTEDEVETTVDGERRRITFPVSHERGTRLPPLQPTLTAVDSRDRAVPQQLHVNFVPVIPKLHVPQDDDDVNDSYSGSISGEGGSRDASEAMED